MARTLKLLALGTFVLLPVVLWLAGLRSSTASVAHGLLLVPSMLLAIALLYRAVRARRRLAMAASLAVLFPALALSAVRALREARPAEPPPSAGALSLVSYNLLFSSRLEGSLALLKRTRADVICLQEVTPASAKRLDAALGESHPHRALEPRHGAYGLAVFSRVPLARPTVVREGRRVAGQCVALALYGAETALCNVHLSSPAGVVERGSRWFRGFDANARVRARQWALLRDHVARTYPQARHLIVAGDFNTLDSEPLYRTIRGSLVDAFAAAGEGPGATFPTEPVSPVPLIRIDYLFASPALVPLSAEVLPQAGSDHRALKVTLAVPPSGGGGR
jgi:endonuclease/exonuclease/phosphatase (EEP) superfamily protein YafD